MSISPRPDLLDLSEDDLVRFTSAGLVKRARREADDAELVARVHEEAGDLICSWSDGITCRFPPASALHGSCSCAAADVCRHLLRSIFHLQNHAELFDTEANPTATGATSEQISLETLLNAEEQLLQRTFSSAELKKARAYLARQGGAEIVEPRSRVHFPSDGVETCFPPGVASEHALCTCGDSMPCRHILPALLLLRGESVPPPAPTAFDQRQWELALGRIRELLFDLMRLGLDGLSSEWCEAARATALEVDKAGWSTHASLVDRLANAVEEELTRHGLGDLATIQFLQAALWLRVRPSPFAQLGNPSLLSSPGVPEQRSGPKQLLGIGARAWENDKVAGLTFYFMDIQTGQIVTTGTARPRESNYTPVQLTKFAPILGEWTASDLANRIVRLSDSTLTHDGKVRLPQGATAEVASIPASSVDIVDRHALVEWSSLAKSLNACYPTIVTLHPSLVHWFKPSNLWPADFRVHDQLFCWPMIDRAGRVLLINYRHRAERSESLDALMRFSREAKPTHVLGRLQWTGSAVSIEPVSFLHEKEGTRPLYIVDVDSWGKPEKTRGRKSARPSP